MKYTDTELETILSKLIASTRSPRGRFSAVASYPQLEKRLKPHIRCLFPTRMLYWQQRQLLFCSVFR